MLLSTLSLDFSAKTWIYMADRAFTWDETDSLRPEIYQFGEQWSSHNQNLLSYGELFHHRFIVLMVDETNAGASGCSIDSSVHFVQAMGQKYNVDFFNRTLFAYMEDEQVIDNLQEIDCLGVLRYSKLLALKGLREPNVLLATVSKIVASNILVSNAALLTRSSLLDFYGMKLAALFNSQVPMNKRQSR